MILQLHLISLTWVRTAHKVCSPSVSDKSPVQIEVDKCVIKPVTEPKLILQPIEYIILHLDIDQIISTMFCLTLVALTAVNHFLQYQHLILIWVPCFSGALPHCTSLILFESMMLHPNSNPPLNLYFKFFTMICILQILYNPHIILWTAGAWLNLFPKSLHQLHNKYCFMSQSHHTTEEPLLLLAQCWQITGCWKLLISHQYTFEIGGSDSPWLGLQAMSHWAKSIFSQLCQ